MTTSSVLRFLLVLGAFIAAAIWLVGAAPNSDLLWFLPAFDARPQAVCVYRYGTTLSLEPGQPGYDEVVRAVNAEIPQQNGFYEGYAPRGATLEHYTTRGYSIMLVYAQPVTVHTRWFFKSNTRLFLAIDGSYNSEKAGTLLFRGDGSQWLPGGLALLSDAQIRAAADAAAATPPSGPANPICTTP